MEKHFLGYPLFSPLIPSDTLFFRTDPFNLRHASWKNPWDATRVSTESFLICTKKQCALPYHDAKASHITAYRTKK